jgi:hypothetical protein
MAALRPADVKPWQATVPQTASKHWFSLHLAPRSPSATTCLVNDLDLTVQASGLAGYTLYGNGQPDRLNNVERVSVLHNHCGRSLLFYKLISVLEDQTGHS